MSRAIWSRLELVTWVRPTLQMWVKAKLWNPAVPSPGTLTLKNMKIYQVVVKLSPAQAKDGVEVGTEFGNLSVLTYGIKR